MMNEMKNKFSLAGDIFFCLKYLWGKPDLHIIHVDYLKIKNIKVFGNSWFNVHL